MKKHMTIAVLAASFLLTACNEDEKKVFVETYPDVTLPVEIAFRAVAGDTAIDCDTELTLGSSNSTGKIADFRFFVHNVRLVLDNGDEVPVELDETAMQTDNIAMLDFRNKIGDCTGAANTNINKKLVGKITLGEGLTGTVTGLAFTLGVPFSHNHASQVDAVGPLKNPGLASGMHWNWQGGYKFTGLDFFPDTLIQRYDTEGNPTTTSNRWNTHLGSTGCAVTTSDLALGIPPTPCDNPNRTDVVLDGFTFNKAVELDYAALLSDNDLSEDLGGPVGCMSGTTDPECEAVFEKLGLVHTLSGGDPLHPPVQTVFSLVEM